MFLYQILQKQRALQLGLGQDPSPTTVQQKPVVAVVKRKHDLPKPIVKTDEPSSPVIPAPSLTDSGVFPLAEVVETEVVAQLDIEAVFKKYSISSKDLKNMETKMMGVPVPIELHERMNAFIQKNKGMKNSPSSLKELALICIQQSLDQLEAKK